MKYTNKERIVKLIWAHLKAVVQRLDEDSSEICVSTQLVLGLSAGLLAVKRERGPLVGINESICSLLMYYNVLMISTLLYVPEAIYSVWKCVLSTAWGQWLLWSRKMFHGVSTEAHGERFHIHSWCSWVCLSLWTEGALDAFSAYQHVPVNLLYHLNPYHE